MALPYTLIPFGNAVGNVELANLDINFNNIVNNGVAYATQVTGNTQNNITQVGPLVNLDVIGFANVATDLFVAGNTNSNYFVGDGSQLTNLNFSNVVGSYGNANVANYLRSGNISGNINIANNVFVGNGAGLSNIVGANIVGGYGNAQVVALLNTNSSVNPMGAASKVAVGNNAGALNSGIYSVAIGFNAGSNNSGANSIAIGSGASPISAPANSITINAGNGVLNALGSGFFVSPIRNDTGNITQAIYYNTATKELTYAPAQGGGGGSGNGVPAGAQYYVQYNNGGQFTQPQFGADVSFQYNPATGNLITPNVVISGAIFYANGSVYTGNYGNANVLQLMNSGLVANAIITNLTLSNANVLNNASFHGANFLQIPTSITPANSSSDTSVATTQYVQNAILNAGSGGNYSNANVVLLLNSGNVPNVIASQNIATFNLQANNLVDFRNSPVGQFLANTASNPADNSQIVATTAFVQAAILNSGGGNGGGGNYGNANVELFLASGNVNDVATFDLEVAGLATVLAIDITDATAANGVIDFGSADFVFAPEVANISDSSNNVATTSFVQNVVSSVSYSDANVAAYLPTYTGNLNSVTLNNVSGYDGVFNTAQLNAPNITGGIIQTAINNYQDANGTPIDFGGTVTITNQPGGNAIYQVQYNDGNGGFGANSNFSFNDTTSNLLVTGNIVGSYLYGDGSNISNIVVTTTYGNANVADYLANGNNVTITAIQGNITTLQGEVYANSNVETLLSSGNVTTANVQTSISTVVTQLAVYADAAARDAAIPPVDAVAGMMIFLTDIGNTTSGFQGYANGAWGNLSLS